MHRFTAVLVALHLLAGCDREQSCRSRTEVDRYIPFGSRYVVEIESAKPALIASQVVPRAEGDTQAGKAAEWRWRGNVLLLGEDGRLTLNDKEYGDIRPGDRVRVHENGRVSVNGEPRP